MGLDQRTVVARLRDYYTEAEAAEWLKSPHPQLDGEIPADLMGEGREADIHAILDRLDSGAYL